MRNIRPFIMTLAAICLLVSCQNEENIINISIKTPPSKVDYVVGESLDLKGLELILVKNNGTTDVVELSDLSDEGLTCYPSNGESLNTSVKDIKITHTETGITESQIITVNKIATNSITIKTPPTKTIYFNDDTLNLSGLVVTLAKNNGDSWDVEFADFANMGIQSFPKNGTKLENAHTEVSIVYGYTDIQTSFQIDLVEVAVNAITVKDLPTINIFNPGDVLDLSGLVITLISDGGWSKDIAFADFLTNNITCSPNQGIKLDLTTKIVTITYTKTGVSCTLNLAAGAGIKDIEGNRYPIVKMGYQTWMASNLRTTKYNDGSPILTTTSTTTDIQSIVTPKFQWAVEDKENQLDLYGRLYTWSAATDVRKICPAGWHVPTELEWRTLGNHLISNGFNYDGTKSGNKYAKSIGSNFGWMECDTEGAVGNSDYPEKINASGFNAFPSGKRWATGSFFSVGNSANWWSSTESKNDDVWIFTIWERSCEMTSNNMGSKKEAMSIRCVKD